MAADPWADFTEAKRQLEAIPVSRLRAKRATWLWADRIPTGVFGLISGREGLGKTQAWCWLAAAISNGTLPGVHHGTPRDVLVVSTEDDWETVLVPRLMAAGADLERVHILVARTPEGTQSELSLPLDVELFGELVVSLDAALVILDPLLSRLADSLDSHKDAEVRRALEPLVKVAQRTRATILGLIHVNKREADFISDTLMGSRAFPAVARVVLHFAYLEGGSRAMGLEKNTHGRREWSCLYELEPATVQGEAGEELPTSRVAWGEELHQYIGDLMREEQGKTTQTEATRWLREYLEGQGGLAAKGAIDGANEAGPGFTQSQLRTARHKLDVEVVRVGYQGGTDWRLPPSIAAPSRGGLQE